MADGFIGQAMVLISQPRGLGFEPHTLEGAKSHNLHIGLDCTPICLDGACVALIGRNLFWVAMCVHDRYDMHPAPRLPSPRERWGGG